MKASDLFSGENVNPTAIFNAHHSYAPKLFRKNLNDLGLNSRYILTQEMEVQITPTGIFGPFAIRSVTIKDLQIFPGTIEWDYIGEIKAMASAPLGIQTLGKGQCIVNGY